MKKLTQTIMLVACLGFAWSAHASIIYSGPGASNVDTNPATTVSLNVADHGTILDLNVAVNIIGGHMEDFILFIEHDGDEAQLNPSLFGHRDLFDATFDDESLNVISDGGNLLGDYQPLELLSIFDGADIFGTWNLSILDSFIPNEGNTLVSWSIEAETSAVPEPATLALFGIGLAGLGFARKKKKSA